ncbi:hypothetical protein CEV31_0680 [Brucella thiophenivorans]|uniref:Uncharacterized protein n=1 Tax=Brucella thiophenivorans TaxID=571255 RepID=A0A256G251_9HYPH|nr:hypothetical protein CEV31_0680 [Brucella thiophenivorans]
MDLKHAWTAINSRCRCTHAKNSREHSSAAEEQTSEQLHVISSILLLKEQKAPRERG